MSSETKKKKSSSRKKRGRPSKEEEFVTTVISQYQGLFTSNPFEALYKSLYIITQAESKLAEPVEIPPPVRGEHDVRLPSLSEVVSEKFTSILKSMYEGAGFRMLNQFLNNVFEYFKPLTNAAQTAIQSMFNFATNVTNVVQSIGQGIVSIGEQIGTAVTQAVEGIGNIFWHGPSVQQSVKQMCAEIVEPDMVGECIDFYLDVLRRNGVPLGEEGTVSILRVYGFTDMITYANKVTYYEVYIKWTLKCDLAVKYKVGEKWETKQIVGVPFVTSGKIVEVDPSGREQVIYWINRWGRIEWLMTHTLARYLRKPGQWVYKLHYKLKEERVHTWTINVNINVVEVEGVGTVHLRKIADEIARIARIYPDKTWRIFVVMHTAKELAKHGIDKNWVGSILSVEVVDHPKVTTPMVAVCENIVIKGALKVRLNMVIWNEERKMCERRSVVIDWPFHGTIEIQWPKRDFKAVHTVDQLKEAWDLMYGEYTYHASMPGYYTVTIKDDLGLMSRPAVYRVRVYSRGHSGSVTLALGSYVKEYYEVKVDVHIGTTLSDWRPLFIAVTPYMRRPDVWDLGGPVKYRCGHFIIRKKLKRGRYYLVIELDTSERAIMSYRVEVDGKVVKEGRISIGGPHKGDRIWYIPFNVGSESLRGGAL